MEVGSLLKPELQYELRVRGKRCDFVVDELRKRVRKIFSKESSGARVYTRYVPNFTEEVIGVEAVLDSLAEADLTATTDKRLIAIYYHVYHRLRYLTNYEEADKEDRDRALLAMRRLTEVREKLLEFLPASAGDLPRLSYAPDSTATLVIGAPPATTDVTEFLPYDLGLEDRQVTGAQGGVNLSVVHEEDDGAMGGVENPIHRSTVRFSEVRSRFLVNPISQSTPITGRSAPSSTVYQLDRERIRREARSVLDNADLRAELDQMRQQMTMLQSQLLQRTSADPPPVSFAASISSPKPGEVHKWNLKFSGSKEESVFSFLENVSEKAISRNVDHALLLKCASDLFSGSALIWYRSGVERKCFPTWSELVSQLKRTFLPQDWEDILLDEIKTRRQGADESIEIYVACVSKMFSRLPNPPSQLAQLKIMWKNLHLFYLERIELLSLNTVNDLLEKGRIIEYARQVTESRRHAETKPVLIDPDLAYKGTTKKKFEPKVGVIDTPLNESKSNKRMCWNCRKEADHMGKDCPHPKSKYCYRCGLPDVVTKTCPNCKKN